jgi:hypothetical protein
MKFFSALAYAAIGYCLSCTGQTNLSSPKTVPFFLPPVQLRGKPKSETVKTELDALKPAVAASPAQTTSVDLVFGDSEMNSRVVKSGEFYLVRPAQPSGDPVVRFVDGIFRPEVVHVGKIPVACSVVTAIKRKNPLCLLNPLVFQASW